MTVQHSLLLGYAFLVLVAAVGGGGGGGGGGVFGWFICLLSLTFQFKAIAIKILFL